MISTATETDTRTHRQIKHLSIKLYIYKKKKKKKQQTKACEYGEHLESSRGGTRTGMPSDRKMALKLGLPLKGSDLPTATLPSHTDCPAKRFRAPQRATSPATNF